MAVAIKNIGAGIFFSAVESDILECYILFRRISRLQIVKVLVGWGEW